MRKPIDAAKEAARKPLVRRPLFVTVLSVLVLGTSGVVGYRQLTAPRFAQVIEVREVSEPEDADGKTAFDVRYRLGDQEDVIRLPYDPGPRIPVERGKLRLEPPTR